MDTKDIIFIFKKNKNLVYTVVNNYKKNNVFNYRTYIDWDEVTQVGMIALWKAIKGYDKTKGSFKNYAIKAIKNDIIRQVNSDRKIETHIDIDNINNLQANKIDRDLSIDYETQLTVLDNIIDRIDCNVKSKKILKLRLRGYTTKDIASIVKGITSQGVQAIIRYHRDNIRDIFNKRYNNVDSI